MSKTKLAVLSAALVAGGLCTSVEARSLASYQTIGAATQVREQLADHEDDLALWGKKKNQDEDCEDGICKVKDEDNADDADDKGGSGSCGEGTCGD